MSNVVVANHEVELIEYTRDAAKKVSRIARVCRAGSDVPLDPYNFVERLINKGHESPLEFADVTFFIQTSRDITHELVRHRIASYMQESTRYVRYDKELTVIRPVDIEEGSDVYAAWYDGVCAAHDSYIKLFNLVHHAELARTVLPGCTRTRIYMHMNMRSFRNFVKLRTSEYAHPDMRHVANLCVRAVRQNGMGSGFLFRATE